MRESPICDECARLGYATVRMEVIPDHVLPGPTFFCGGHRRLYHAFVGYQPAKGPGEVLKLPCSNSCGGMYISSLNAGTATLKCPICSFETRESLQKANSLSNPSGSTMGW